MLKIGRNDPCFCGAKDPEGNPIKYKKCCESLRNQAISVLRRNKARIDKTLYDLMISRGDKHADVRYDIDPTGHIWTYYLNNIKALKIDYTGLPMQIETKEDMIKVAAVDVNSIPIETY